MTVCVPEDYICDDPACETLSIYTAIDVESVRLVVSSIDYTTSDTVLAGEVSVTSFYAPSCFL